METLTNKFGKVYPRILYKYMSVPEYLIDLIESKAIYLNDPDQLNDPFDFRYTFSKEYLTEKYKLHSKDYPKSLMKFANHQWVLDYATKKFKNEFRELTFVYSMTALKNSPLFWGYYGKGFEGFCLELDLKYAPDDMRRCTYEVIYGDEILSIKTDDDINKAHCYKLKDWAIEKEYRTVYNNNSKKIPEYTLDQHRRLGFDLKFLKSITFGYKVEDEFIKTIVDLCNKKELGLTKFYKAEFNSEGIVYHEWKDLDKSKSTPEKEYNDQINLYKRVLADLIEKKEFTKVDFADWIASGLCIDETRLALFKKLNPFDIIRQGFYWKSLWTCLSSGKAFYNKS